MPKRSATCCWISSTEVAWSRAGARDDLGDQLGAERARHQRGVGEDAGEGTVQLADVGVDAVGELGEGAGVGDLDASLHHEAAQDGEPGRQVRRLDGDGQAPLEAVAETPGESRELARDAVGGEDDLAARLVQGVEGVEELLLGARLALEELDVVDEEHVDIAVAGLEALAAGGAQGGDELVGEGLGGRVADAESGGVGVQVVGDRRQQVGLAETGRAVEEEGVVGLRGGLGDGEGGSVGEAVAGRR